MFYLFFGTDRAKANAELNRALEKVSAGADIVRITDAHTLADLQVVLQGPGMFAPRRTVVLDSLVGSGSEAMRETLVGALDSIKVSKEIFFILEGALDAATRKQIEKYAEKAEKFDAPKKEKDNSIFALANALQRGDKKALWVGLMAEFAKGSAPEAVHGLLFWGAKQMLLKSSTREKSRAEALVASLAELPHEARRRGEDLEYALERFALSKSVT